MTREELISYLVEHGATKVNADTYDTENGLRISIYTSYPSFPEVLIQVYRGGGYKPWITTDLDKIVITEDGQLSVSLSLDSVTD